MLGLVKTKLDQRFLKYILPDNINENRLFQIEHPGFRGYEHRAAEKYLSQQGISKPSAPMLAPEFTNPLFLKTCCQALKANKQTTFPKGLHGITRLFDFYIQSVEKTVARHKHYTPEEEIVKCALTTFSSKLFPEYLAGMPTGETRKLFKEHDPNENIGEPLFDKLLHEGVLSDLNSTCKCNRLGSWHRKGQLVYFPWPFQTQLPTEALMGTYHQLTEHQRYQIYALKKAGHDQQSIAATVAVSPSTICRELRRNQGQRGYRPGQAHHKALARRRHKAKATKMTAAVIERIEAGLGQQWSPEQIAGRLATTDGFRLSPQRIYQHIQADRQAGGMLYRHLRHSQKKRKKRYGKADARGQIKGRISIDQRPAIVEEKSRIGDWEIDLVMGRARTGALVSVVERRSRYTVLGKVPSKQAEHVAAATIALLAAHKGHTETITADNGKEFAHHATISQALDAAVYFAHPYHAWERGLNENTNGLIRQYVPKGTALDTLSQAQVHHIMERLNHRPRKGLAFQTPHEILCKETEVQPKHGEIALTS